MTVPLSLEQFRSELIDKILFAASKEEVKHFCDDAMMGLEHHNVNGHAIARFVDKLISELDQFNPMDKDAQQWSNIRMARIHVNRIRKRLNPATH